MLARRLLLAGGGGKFTVEDDVVAGVLNLLNYGADPTGSSDDTPAFATAIGDMPSAGRVLLVPPGIYNCDPGTIILPERTALLGYGAHADAYISEIRVNGDGNLIEWGGHGCIVRDVALTNADPTPSSGAAIAAVTGTGNHATIDGVVSEGFYQGFDLRYGAEWRLIGGSYILDTVSHGLLIDNIDIPDGGDQAVSDLWIGCKDKTDDSSAIAIYMTGGGGLKMTNVKINKGAAGTTGKYRNFMSVQIPATTQTGVILVSNCSMENSALHGVTIEVDSGGQLDRIEFSNCEIAPINSANGYGLYASAAASGGITHLLLTGSTVQTVSSTENAVTLTNIAVARITGVTRSGFAGMYGNGGGNSDVIFTASA